MLTDKADKIMPKYKAWSFFTFPVGIGLKQVLLIKASKSDSYHILSVPAAPEPIATAKREIQAVEKSTLIGEILAKRAKEKNIDKVYFDRGENKYHGRVKNFADSLRKNGLKF